MSFSCPNCGHLIPSADLNVQTDVALCRSCNHLGKLSDFTSTRIHPDTVTTPPAGAWRHDSFAGPVFGATTRSALAFFLVPFMLVWSGGSLGGIYGRQIMKGEFDLFLSLFGIPFLAGAVLFWGITLMAIAGRVEVKVGPDGRGEVFTGVGRFGRRRTFDLAEIDTITEETSIVRNRRNHSSHQRKIVLSGRTRLAFGGGLTDARRHFILQTLRSLQPARR